MRTLCLKNGELQQPFSMTCTYDRNTRHDDYAWGLSCTALNSASVMAMEIEDETYKALMCTILVNAVRILPIGLRMKFSVGFPQESEGVIFYTTSETPLGNAILNCEMPDGTILSDLKKINQVVGDYWLLPREVEEL